MEPRENLFSVFAGLFQLLLIILFGVFVEYSDSKPGNLGAGYSFFQDVHVMLFVGIGFLYSFLRKYSFGSIGFNMFIAALMLQWSTIVGGLMRAAFGLGTLKLKLDLNSMLGAEFATATVLISFGTVLGKVGRLQLMLLGIIEIIFFYVNECVIVKYIKISDVGGSITIHVFASFFGLALSRMIYKKEHRDNDKEGSDYRSDVFAILGTMFLWMFWPSFNASGVVNSPIGKQRALVNTYFSMAACCVTIFVVSPLVTKQKKTDMIHVQNASLAGGVAIGACANLLIGIWAALLLGALGGLTCILGFAYVQPFLLNKFNIHDTAGVNNLHGMPGILATCASAAAALNAHYDTYGMEVYNIWPARRGVGPSMRSGGYDIIPGGGNDREETAQALMQIVAMVITIMVAILSGILTGFLVRCLSTDALTSPEMFDDENYWLQAGQQNDNELNKTDETSERRELLVVSTQA